MMIFRFFANMKIKHKILVSFSPLFLIGALSMTYLFYNIAEHNIIVNASKDNLNIVKQVSEKIEIVNQNIISVSNMYFLNEDVRKLLKNTWSEDDYEGIITRRSIQETMEKTSNQFEHMQHSTVILGFNGVYYSSDNRREQDEDQLRIQTWLDKIEENIDKILWTNTYFNNDKFIFSAIRYIRDIYTGKPLGLLLLDFDEQILFNMYRNLDDKEIMILNGDGVVLSTRNKQLLSTHLVDQDFFQKLSDYQSGYFVSDFHHEKTLVSFYLVEPMNWYVVDLTPLSSLLDKMENIKMYFLLLTFVILTVVFILSYALAHIISAPIKKLVNSMRKASAGDLGQLLSMRRNDEMGILISRYNTMINKIDQLMKETVVQNEAKRKAEIRALLAQMNPHFLYNTLNSIRWMAKTNRPDMVNRMIISLVRLLKQTIGTENEFISIAEERQFLEDYVTIQKVRYGDKFDVRIDFSPEILDGKIIKLLLQPIMENAIFHGIEPKEGPGRITVTGYLRGENVLIEIEDDGVGMEDSSALVQNGQIVDVKRDDRGFGLRSIEERIKMHFGNRYGISLTSEKGKGTKVTLVLPWITDYDVKDNRDA